MLVGNAIYREGVRTGSSVDLDALYAACNREDGSIVWVGLLEPGEAEFSGLTRAFDLHELAVEDAVLAHQRPKLERYGDSLFIALRTARYVDATETVEFGEVHLFVGPRFVVTVRHGEASELHRVRENLEARPERLKRGTMAIVHAILDRIVDDFEPVAAGLENDIDEIENDVFAGNPDVSRRIYELTREVIEFQRATVALPDIMRRLMADPAVDDEERSYLRDVEDHALRMKEQIVAFRDLLQNILNVNLTLEAKALNVASIEQNEEVKKISAWAAIFFAPTLVGTIYGMNFANMPELQWRFGYPLAIGVMVLGGLVLYLIFKRRHWL